MEAGKTRAPFPNNQGSQPWIGLISFSHKGSGARFPVGYRLQGLEQTSGFSLWVRT